MSNEMKNASKSFQFPQNLTIDNFTIFRQLENPRDSSIKVFQGEFNLTHKKCMIKRITMNKDNEATLDGYHREIDILERANHSNIIEVYTFFTEGIAKKENKEDPKILLEDYKSYKQSKMRKYMYVIFEDFSIYSLEDKMNRQKSKAKTMNKQEALKIFIQVTQAIEYLHSMEKKVIYRNFDLKDIQYNKMKGIKLTGFSTSNYANEGKRDTFECKSNFTAPELFHAENGYDERVDIWNLGVLLYHLLTNKFPFEGNNFEEMKKNIFDLNIKWNDDLENEENDLIRRILVIDPNERYTIKEICQHRLFKSYFPISQNHNKDSICSFGEQNETKSWVNNSNNSSVHLSSFFSNQSSIINSNNWYNHAEIDEKDLLIDKLNKEFSDWNSSIKKLNEQELQKTIEKLREEKSQDQKEKEELQKTIEKLREEKSHDQKTIEKLHEEKSQDQKTIVSLLK